MMNLLKTTPQKSAKEKIIETATDLFYRQGYQATGINEIIEKSGVAKATFYAHFPSKEDLCLAYARGMARRHLVDLKVEVAKRKSPYQRYMALIEGIGYWMKSNHYKGCGFLNIVSEITDPRHPIREEGKKHYEELRQVVEDAAQELIESDRKKYGHLDAHKVSQDYMVIVSGAIAMGEIYHEPMPLQKGKALVEGLVR